MALEKKEEGSTNKMLRKLAVSLNELEEAVDRLMVQERTFAQINDAINNKLFVDGTHIPDDVVLSDGATFGSLDYSDVEEDEQKGFGAKQ